MSTSSTGSTSTTPRPPAPGAPPDEHLEFLAAGSNGIQPGGVYAPRPSRFAGLRRLVPAWLRRRAWLLVIAVLVGAVAGLIYGSTTPTSYTGTATLAVPTGANQTGPGSAFEAQQLAANYAAVIRQDSSLLTPAAKQLGVPVDALANHLSVGVESGTSVLTVAYTAPTKQEAIRGANAIVAGIVKQERTSSVVPADTLNIVQLATDATGSGLFAKFGLLVGVFLGLLVGAILVLVAERLDPRADTSADVTQVFDYSVAALPSELSLAEFGHAVVGTAQDQPDITLAPLRWWDVPAAHHIEQTMAEEFPDKTITVSTALEEGLAHRLQSDSKLVLVIRSGEQLHAVGDVLERLRLMGSMPEWIALLDRDDLYD